MRRSAPADPLVGRFLAERYRVVRRLEQGGMGSIYVALQEPLGREVALKVLRREYAADVTALQRFQKEAQAVSRLSHPNLVAVFDFGHDDGHLFIAMELVRGRSLRKVLEQDGPLPWRRALHVIRGITSGLVEAHGQGLMHRDLKPENVMLTPAGSEPEHVKLLDFGLARSVQQGADDPKLTQQNAIPGTPGYMPPERVSGVPDDLRGDLYSLGALWFELLTGRLPFPAETPVKMLVRHLHDPAPSPREHGADPQLPAAADALVLQLLEKRPEDRPKGAQELLLLLLGLEGGDGWSVATASQIAAVATTTPSHPGWAAEISTDLDFAPALEPISSLEEEDEESAAPIELTRRKGEEPVPLVTRKRPARAPIVDVEQASSRLARAASLEEVGEIVVDFLLARFDAAAVVDLRAEPVQVIASAGLRPDDEVARAVERTDVLWQRVDGGQAYYGAALEGEDWRAFHTAVSGRAPAGVLLAALRRNSRPALLLLAEHERGPLLSDLKSLGQVMSDMASSLTHLRF